MDDDLTKPPDPDGIARGPERRPSSQPPATASPSPPPDPGPSAGEPVGCVDLPSLLHRCLGKRELAERLIQKLAQQADQDLANLEEALRLGNAAEARAVAHRLKGAAANVSALKLRDIASALETLGREGNLAPAQPLMVQLRLAVERVKALAKTGSQRS